MTGKERILDAAISVFARKGRHGAHVGEIAALAHINKAMIYYFYHNKDDLYFEVLKFVINRMWISFSQILSEGINAGKDYIEIISDQINIDINFFSQNRNYAKILVDALSSGSEEIPLAVNIIKKTQKDDTIQMFKDFIEKGKSENIIRKDIDPDQFFLSITGMTFIHFLTQASLDIFDIKVDDEAQFLKERADSIIDLILNGIIIKNQ